MIGWIITIGLGYVLGKHLAEEYAKSKLKPQKVKVKGPKKRPRISK